MKAFLDFIPLIAFFYGAKMDGGGIITGALYLLVATVAVYAIHFVRQKKLDKQQWFILLITVAFCAITIQLNNDVYLRWKSPIINVIFALVLVISVAFKRPLMQMALKDYLKLTPSGFAKLTLAWAAFFLAMAVLHYLFAFNAVLAPYWVDFKTFGQIPFMLVFLIAQFVILKDYIIEPPAKP